MVGVRMEPVQVEEVVYAALASLSIDVSSVDVAIPVDLPPAEADPALLERALANVVLNALNWAPTGTRVRVQGSCAGNEVDVRVIDRGAGIPRDQRDTVFQPFQRLGDASSIDHDGIGLGLAVTVRFRGRHGWPGRRRRHPGRRHDHRHRTASRAVSRILVVDDDVRILKTLEVNLRARGYDFDLARTGEAALQVAARRHPDAVILDLGLPGLDGSDVIHGLRGWSTVPIVVLSGRGTEAAKVEALDLGRR